MESRVPADDASFMAGLDTMSWAAARDYEAMSETRKAVHCQQARRAARAFGFLAE